MSPRCGICKRHSREHVPEAREAAEGTTTTRDMSHQSEVPRYGNGLTEGNFRAKTKENTDAVIVRGTTAFRSPQPWRVAR
jgi:hypothetical protein